jgi:single-stranded-DNA-specific exonuclease
MGLNKTKKWIKVKTAPKKFIDQFPEYSKIVLQLLYNRGIKTEGEIEKFLNPDYERDLYDPFLMKDMDKAVIRIKKAIDNKEKIVIYGDYDVDGVTATAVLYKTLKFLKAKNLDYYIPDRNKEGYSLNKKAVLSLVKDKTNLIITVDCGITNQEEVKIAKQKHIDVIITDHHLVPEKLPLAYAILNPKQKNDKYPFSDLAGVGVSFKLSQALLKEKGIEGESFLKWMMDLVGLGTVADVVTLISENRVFVKYGLIVLKKTKNLGIRALMTKSKTNPANLDTDNLNFQLIPRLNAAGRMDHAYSSLKLLITDSYNNAERIAENLNALNSQRQRLIEQILKEAHEKIGTFKVQEKILIISHKVWPITVLGLVAGRLAEEYNRPTILIEKGDKESRGSARSFGKINISNLLKNCNGLMTQFGGHAGAAGFSLKTKDLNIFEEKIRKVAFKKIKNGDLIPKINIEAEIKLSDICWDFYQEVESLKPFGEGNHEPIFLLQNAEIKERRSVGNREKHLKLHFEHENKIIKAIGFNLGNQVNSIKNEVDITCSIKANYWNGACDLEFNIYDLK